MSIKLTKRPEWIALNAHLDEIKDISIQSLFDENPERHQQFSLKLRDFYYDFSKNNLTKKTIDLLINLAKSSDLETKINNLFNGKIVNHTEKRPALHVQLRNGTHKNTLLKNISANIRMGNAKGATGKTIDHIVHIGLGGSELGPRMVDYALQQEKIKTVKFSFVANIDGADIQNILDTSDPEKTIFVIASKSFTTQETIVNSNTARQWLLQSMPSTTKDKIIKNHFIGITANIEQARLYGLHDDSIILFDEAVNGRYSIWSGIAISFCIACGFESFEKLLLGAKAMDDHFIQTPLSHNIPVIMALIDIWHRNFWGFQTKAVIPYAQELKLFPAYLQQLEMESNGKSINLNGEKITDYDTAPVIFGEVGTNSQHSFFQLFHQGTNIIPCDFIGFKNPTHTLPLHHDHLLDNMLAQSQALMQGRPTPHNPHQYFSGNRPSSILLIDRLDAYHLGMLIALYEHKVFVQSVIWNINCFDQFGVELGKEMAHKLEKHDLSHADNSTINLVKIIRNK